MPVELQRPIEATNVGEVGLRVVVLESVVVDHIDYGAYDRLRIALDPVE